MTNLKKELKSDSVRFANNQFLHNKNIWRL